MIFAIILLTSYFMKKPILKLMLAKNMQLEDKIWQVLTLRWAIFFIALGILNEFVWRNYSQDVWVNFKVFGLMGITLLFTLSQLPTIINNQKNL